MLTRKQILKGRGFANRDPEVLRALRQAEKSRNIDVLLAGKGRMANMAGSTSGVPISKEQASQSQAYQVATRSIGYCMRCGCTLQPKAGVAQFCHADLGKGMGIKTDIRLGWNGCAGCHFWVGRIASRAVRRAVEAYLAWKNRCALRRMGLWPRSVPDTSVVADATPIENPEART